MKKKTALIFGITGQDGAYLSKFLIKKGYVVHGVVRRSSTINTYRLDDIYTDPFSNKKKLILHYGDITDSLSVYSIIKKLKPNEIYNLAAQSHVAVSFQIPEYTSNADALGTLRILEAIVRVDKKIKFYQAGSSEMFGKVVEIPQTEKTPFYPRSPYGVAKVYSYWITANYRESYNLFACNGILFNHESTRRGSNFVTNKVVKNSVRIALGFQKYLEVGNIHAYRDWGHAKDYVIAMQKILNYKKPDDWVVATGETYTVEDFLVEAFNIVDLDWKQYVETSEKYFRPNEVDY